MIGMRVPLALPASRPLDGDRSSSRCIARKQFSSSGIATWEECGCKRVSNGMHTQTDLLGRFVAEHTATTDAGTQISARTEQKQRGSGSRAIPLLLTQAASRGPAAGKACEKRGKTGGGIRVMDFGGKLTYKWRRNAAVLLLRVTGVIRLQEITQQTGIREADGAGSTCGSNTLASPS